MDCEIITFEVERKDFSLLPGQDKRVAFGTKSKKKYMRELGHAI
jgi:hypothetical protein